MNIQEKNTIYYGTDIKYLEEIDHNGIAKPRERDEEFISVSISGYQSDYELSHPDLVEFGRVYSELLGIAKVVDNKLQYKEGYENSMTYVEGFGPNPSEYLRGFFGLVENVRTQNTMTAVISPDAYSKLVIPSKEREFEYLSLALHGFLAEITPDMIIAWILPEMHVEHVRSLMADGTISKKVIISDVDLNRFNVDDDMIVKYGSKPEDIEFYFKKTRRKHLMYVLSEFNDIDWSVDDDEFENEMDAWYKKSASVICWCAEDMKYRFQGV